jgi:hypothetical protein
MNIAGNRIPRSRVLVAACGCELAALALMSWQFFDPRPAQVIVAMSFGQILGTASFLAFLHVVWRDLRAARRAAREAVDRDTAE